MMRKPLLVLALLALLPVASLGAGTVSIDYQGHGLGYDASFLTVYHRSGPGGAYESYSGFVGQFLIKGLSGDQTDIAYCLDFFESLEDPETVTVRPIADYPDGGNAPAHALSGVGEKIGWLLNRDVSGNLHAAALQLAIWEVAFDSNSPYDLSSGLLYVQNFGTTSGERDRISRMIGYANDYLAIMGSSKDAAWLDVNVTGCTHGQDLGVATDPVPEPASMILLGSGLLGLGAAARRKRTGRN